MTTQQYVQKPWEANQMRVLVYLSENVLDWQDIYKVKVCSICDKVKIIENKTTEECSDCQLELADATWRLQND